MVVQTLIGIIYEVTQHSWAAASIAVKYYLATVCIYLYTNEGLTKEKFAEKLLDDSRLFLTGVVVAGIVLYAANFKPAPFVKFFSEVVALGYLAFLFWKY